MKGCEINHEAVAAFFSPESIAVIGASGDEAKIGGRPIRYLRLGGYAGRVYPINPGRSVVQDLPSYNSLAAVPGNVDLAIIAVPAQQVPAAVEQCVAKGVRGATIFSSGFAETGAEGSDLQDQALATARAGGLRLLGPNCMGTMNLRQGVIATFTSGIVDHAPARGRISLASQSGAFGSHCFILAEERQLGINLWATTGNQSDLEVADFLSYMAADPETDVVIGCLEGVKNPKLLIEAFELARLHRKPMIVMKLGRSAVGVEAAASHTASLGGSDAVFDAVLRQYDVYRATSIDDLFDAAYACSRGRFSPNRDVGLITVSGGVGIIMADAAAECGLSVPALPDATQAFLKEKVPFAGTRNPLDVTAQIVNQPDLVEPMFEALIAEGGHGAIVAFLSHLGRNPALIAKLMPGLTRVARRYVDRPLILSLLAAPDVREQLEGLGYLVFADPTRAVRAAAILAHFGTALAAGRDHDAPPAALPGMQAVEPGRVYTEVEAKELLAAAGLPVVREVLTSHADEAAAAAARTGFPVVMKIASADIAHKSEIGGVLLNVPNEAAVRTGFATLVDRAKAAAPNARIAGVIVAPMVTGGVETILGMLQDPVVGPVVMFGLGGVLVEVLGDVTFRLAPFGPGEARAMIGEVKGRALLRGARGAEIMDETALEQALVRLSVFAAAQAGSLASIDVNPFIVLPQGRGALAVDALVVTRSVNPVP